MDLADKTCIVTGGNTGIGLETVRGLARDGARVIIACRDEARGKTARDDVVASTGNESVEVMLLDLASLESVRAFASQVRDRVERLELLVNNAGVWPRARQSTADGFELTFGVNHLGHFALVQELRPLIEKSAPARIVNLSSRLHYRGSMRWDDLMMERGRFSGPKAYSQSKLANVLFTLALARRLADSGVTCNAVHPGVVRTELARSYPRLLVKLFHLFLISPEQGAATSLRVATDPDLATTTGEYFEDEKVRKPSSAALDEKDQERLWNLSEKFIAAGNPGAA